MADIHWVRIISWHAIRREPNGPDADTYCGRYVAGSPLKSTDLPMGEKSCESCARLVIHDQENGEADRG